MYLKMSSTKWWPLCLGLNVEYSLQSIDNPSSLVKVMVCQLFGAKLINVNAFRPVQNGLYLANDFKRTFYGNMFYFDSNITEVCSQG